MECGTIALRLQLLLALAAAAGAGVVPTPDQQIKALEMLPVEQLAQVLSAEMLAEDKRPMEETYRFAEFQEVSQMDCSMRLFYLMNTTVTLRDALRGYHTDMIGLSGLFVQLLRKMPNENSWVWLLANTHERGVQKIQTYFSRVLALCVDQHQCIRSLVKDALLKGVEGWKNLSGELVATQWYGFAHGTCSDPDSQESDSARLAGGMKRSAEESFIAGNIWLAKVRSWFDEYTSGLYDALLTLEKANQLVVADGGPVRLHHQDEHGSFVTYEFLRRKVFGQWAIDRGLVRGLLRNVWQPGYGDEAPITVGDFGAGGGHYSKWMNETGLLQAFAFDGTHQAAELTDGLVQEVNLVQKMSLWRTFDWVLCLEVGEHIPKEYSDMLLSNLKNHAKKGLVMSWSDDWEGIGHVNCLTRQEFVATVQRKTGFVLDSVATEAVRSNCEIDYIARTLAVFRAPA